MKHGSSAASGSGRTRPARARFPAFSKAILELYGTDRLWPLVVTIFLAGLARAGSPAGAVMGRVEHPENR